MTSATRHPPSLRKRYITTTLILGILVVSVVAISYLNMRAIKNVVTDGYQGVVKEKAHLKEIRNTLLTVNQDINLFLLDPGNEDLTTKIDANTDQSLRNLLALQNSQHGFHVDIGEQVAPMVAGFKLLNQEVKRLVEYRLDINKQYPAMDVSANIMEVQQDRINSGFEILLNEIESGDLALNTPAVYPLLLKTQLLWVKAISQTRIYMTNRLATFSIEMLQDQGRSLTDIYELFMADIQRLRGLYRHEDSFEGTATLEMIENTARQWHEKFLIMREIAESDRWRSDMVIMKNQVFPVVSAISQQGDALEKVLNVEKAKIDEALKRSDESFNHLIFAIIFLFLLVIAAMLVSMEWMIFTPIERVTLALRSKASDLELPQIETAKSLEIARLIEAFNEMNQEVSQRQHDLEYQALHDHLTGLPNRFMLHQRMEYQLLSSERQHSAFALFVMDLDFFKEINDTLGHASGDQLLIEASTRIQRRITKSDTMARLGGDEFAILLPDCDEDRAKALARDIIEEISHPFDIGDEKVSVMISIGMAAYPKDGDTAEILLQYADMAMYNAKRKRSGYAVYNPEENFYSKERLSLIRDLLEALENNAFELYYQPKLNLADQRIDGAEALIRWHHQDYGWVQPEIIIEAAERAGAIHKLSLNILQKAIAQCAQWHRQGYRLAISVNLSVRDLSNKHLSEQIKGLLDQHQLDYAYLTLEITESVMMENLALSLEQLNKLHQLGVCLSIDDFGTGFSSLAYLKRLPVNELKIDKSFIMDLGKEVNDIEIVSSTINLGHSLGLRVVAEGVENQAVLDRVQRLGCDQIQGYHISKPVEAGHFTSFLQAWSGQSASSNRI
jgi:diguanylate cyclase (GGDEF)-like protein